MKVHTGMYGAFAAGLAAAALIATAAGAASTTPGPPAPGAASMARGPAAAAATELAARHTPDGRTGPGGRAITLITGTRLVLATGRAGSGGRPMAATAVVGRAGPLISMSLGGTRYEFPPEALPYLGRGLNPDLFSVTALAAAETAGRLPVRVGYRGRVPSIPGVTITRAAGGTASGYLTAQSARVFGAALAAQLAADRGHGRYGTDGLFGGDTSVSVAGASPAAARAALPATGQADLGRAGPAATGLAVHTLTFRADDAGGQPDNGDSVFLVNMDNSDLLQAVSTFTAGTARFAVPAGHYFAITEFTDRAANLLAGIRVVVVPQITVSRDLTVRTDAAAAASQITMVTPRPAIAQQTTFELLRVPSSGNPIDFQQSVAFSPAPIKVNTTRAAPTVGTLATFTSQYLISPASAAAPYQYNLAYQDLSGIIHAQRRQIRAAGLATVTTRYFSAATIDPLVSINGLYPIQQHEAAETFFVPSLFTGSQIFPSVLPAAPAQITQYFTASPALLWEADISRQDPSGPLFSLQFDARSYRAGARLIQDWNAYPQHTAPNMRVTGAPLGAPVVASASRAGNVLTVLLSLFSDDTPGHTGVDFESVPDLGSTASFEIDQNGHRIAAGNALSSPSWHAVLSPRPSVIRFALNASRDVSLYPLSSRTSTAWTWRSAAQPGASLPAGWTCPSVLTTSLRDRICAAQPLLSLEYQLAGMSLRGVVPAGQQHLTVGVGHFQPSATTAAITAVRVQVSYDNGATWQDAAVTRQAAGTFAAAYTPPATARLVSLRVTAADASGTTITETIWGAYMISG
jgi:hypothetical protein